MWLFRCTPTPLGRRVCEYAVFPCELTRDFLRKATWLSRRQSHTLITIKGSLWQANRRQKPSSPPRKQGRSGWSGSALLFVLPPVARLRTRLHRPVRLQKSQVVLGQAVKSGPTDQTFQVGSARFQPGAELGATVNGAGQLAERCVSLFTSGRRVDATNQHFVERPAGCIPPLEMRRRGW